MELLVLLAIVFIVFMASVTIGGFMIAAMVVFLLIGMIPPWLAFLIALVWLFRLFTEPEHGDDGCRCQHH